MSQSTGGTTERHDETLAAIGRRIVSGAQPAGSVLTLDAICTEHGVSRTVAREVIKVLESMGLVESRRRVGITIQPRTRWSVFDPRLIRWRLDGADRAEFLSTLSELRRGFEPDQRDLGRGPHRPAEIRRHRQARGTGRAREER